MTFSKPYPDLTSAAARAEAEAALASIKSSVDPAAEKTAEESKPDGVQAVVEEFINRRVAGTRTQGSGADPASGNCVRLEEPIIIDIRRPDVLRVVDAISDRGAMVMANRTLGVLKRLFGW